MGFSLWHLVVVLVIILLLFGTKKLRSIGSDLGGAVKGFRDSMKDEKDEAEAPAARPREQLTQQESSKVIEGQVTSKEQSRDKV